MNRILSSAMVVLFSISGPGTSAQQLFTYPQQLITYHFTADDEYVTSNVPLNEISARAFRNFIRTFGFVPAAIWRKEDQGYTVRWYTGDSVGYIVHYTPRGMLFDTHVYFTPRNAPKEIRNDMKQLYPEYSILFVNELADGEHPLYEVGLTGDGLTLIVDVKDKAVQAEQYFTPSR